MNNVPVSKIADFLEANFLGIDYEIKTVKSLGSIEDYSIVFSKNKNIDNYSSRALILVPLDFEYCSDAVYSIIKVKNPRLVFAKVVNAFFIDKTKSEIHKTALIGDGCNIDSSVSIGPNCVVGNNVIIGKNTVFKNNIVIYDNTTIGNNCYIKSGAVIGEDGFGFDFEDDGQPIRIPHLGRVSIGDNVEIGSNTVIVRGTLDSTVIENNVKIDDMVFMAHNCHIRENTVIIAFAEISGSVSIGKNCWIGPNCSIIQKVCIGDNVTVGIGSVITSDIENNKKIMGLEGLDLRNLLKVKKRIEYGK
jgi:UDP-3-O-[3-hydroxymyristoyl] glucosamine N-acyltransferase